ncbi:hypothetical protein H4R34_000572 [Dimargaris verticillata]|uniref:Fungal lipase-type domain-containing protein n=1 Tax=Dimargaris verticillata TaxID=2761393 RepID=A0A9W8B546_9FUNG|nr:hypothetical protein H4R34_000572 [Dimargaris verticillata]
MLYFGFSSSSRATYEWGYHALANNGDGYYDPSARRYQHPQPLQHRDHHGYYVHPGDSEDELSERELWELEERIRHQHAWAPPRVRRGSKSRHLPPSYRPQGIPHPWSASRAMQPIRHPSRHYSEDDRMNYYYPGSTYLPVAPREQYIVQHPRYTYPVNHEGTYRDGYNTPHPSKDYRHRAAPSTHPDYYQQQYRHGDDYALDTDAYNTMYDQPLADGYASDGDGLVLYENDRQALQPAQQASKQNTLRRAKSMDVSQVQSSQALDNLGVFVQVERYPQPDNSDTQKCRIIEIEDGDEQADGAIHTSEAGDIIGDDTVLGEGLVFDSPEKLEASQGTLIQNPSAGPAEKIDSASKAKLLRSHSNRLRNHQAVDDNAIKKLKIFARYALATYLPPNGGNCHLLRGQDIQAKLKVMFRTSNPPLQGFIAVDSRQKHVVVAIRGSTGHDLKTFLYDAHFSKTEWPEVWPGSKVHKGFLSIAKAAMESLTADLAPYLVDPEYKFSFVGHSLGGAVVTLFMVNFISQYPMATSKCELVTFGQPMVGNYDFAWYLNALGINKSRVTHGLDIVPSLAGKAAGYYHFSGEVYIDRWTGTTYYCSQDEETLEDDKDCSKAVKSWSSDTRDHKVFWGISRRTPEAEVKPKRRKSLNKFLGL